MNRPAENELFRAVDFLPPIEGDPWNRYSALEHDAVIVVEFCEVVGPRPVLVVPTCPGAHFDADALALWLMTTDYHLSNRATAPFALAEDVGILLYNEEQGVHAYAVHFMLYELAARGYHRPYAVAYLTKEPTLLPALLPKLSDALSAVLAALKRCNRKLFLREIAQALDALNNVESQAVATYYELYFDNNQPCPISSQTSRAERIHLKTRKICRDLELTHAILHRVVKKENKAKQRDYPHCGDHSISLEEWTGKVLETRDPSVPVQLKPLSGLCPCLHQEACNELRHIWCQFRRASPFDAFLPFDPQLEGPRLTIDSSPLLTIPPLPGRKRSEAESEEEVSGEVRERRQNESGPESRLLVSMLPALPSLLSPLLSGQFLLVAGSEMRKPTLQAFLSKLRRLMPSGEASETGVLRRWHEGRVPATAFADYKLFGVRLNADESLESLVAENILSFINVLNLNADTLTASRYKGRLLAPLAAKTPDLFPSDAILFPYIRYLVHQVAAVGYVIQQSVYGNPERFRRAVRRQGDLATALRLHPDDLRLARFTFLTHLVELLKELQPGTPRLHGAFDNLFLEHTPHSLIKL